MTFVVTLVCVLPILVGASVPPGVKAGVFGGAMDESDYVVNLKPPSESTQEVLDSLSALASAEEAKRVVADEAFAAEKERLIEAERIQIKALVDSAIAKLRLKL